MQLGLCVNFFVQFNAFYPFKSTPLIQLLMRIFKYRLSYLAKGKDVIFVLGLVFVRQWPTFVKEFLRNFLSTI